MPQAADPTTLPAALARLRQSGKGASPTMTAALVAVAELLLRVQEHAAVPRSERGQAYHVTGMGLFSECKTVLHTLAEVLDGEG